MACSKIWRLPFLVVCCLACRSALYEVLADPSYLDDPAHCLQLLGSAGGSKDANNVGRGPEALSSVVSALGAVSHAYHHDSHNSNIQSFVRSAGKLA